MTPFLVDEHVIKMLSAIRKAAEANPYSEQLMRTAVATRQFAIPPSQCCTLPFGYTLKFTIEWQPLGVVRHLSVASPSADHVVRPEAINMMLPHLGFAHNFEACGAYLEPLPDGRTAVNVLLPIGGRTMIEAEQEYSSNMTHH